MQAEMDKHMENLQAEMAAAFPKSHRSMSTSSYSNGDKPASSKGISASSNANLYLRNYNDVAGHQFNNLVTSGYGSSTSSSSFPIQNPIGHRFFPNSATAVTSLHSHSTTVTPSGIYRCTPEMNTNYVYTDLYKKPWNGFWSNSDLYKAYEGFLTIGGKIKKIRVEETNGHLVQYQCKGDKMRIPMVRCKEINAEVFINPEEAKEVNSVFSMQRSY